MTAYSPERRTALVLTGTGAHGAYHAGVLRALQEAGVKIDILAGHGIGAGSARWPRSMARRVCGIGWHLAFGVGSSLCWRWPFRGAALIGVVLLLLLAPLAVLLVGLIVYLARLPARDAAGRGGGTLVALYSGVAAIGLRWTDLPTTVPRAATIALVAIIVCSLLAVDCWVDGRAAAAPRGGWWWRMLGAPLTRSARRSGSPDAIWDLIRGAAPMARPSMAVLGRRYSEVLVENLGQPGFRELVLVATDLDARVTSWRRCSLNRIAVSFLAPRVGRDRRAGARPGRCRSRSRDGRRARRADAAARQCDPYPIEFAPTATGAAKRTAPAIGRARYQRLLEEVAAAGARAGDRGERAARRRCAASPARAAARCSWTVR